MVSYISNITFRFYHEKLFSKKFKNMLILCTALPRTAFLIIEETILHGSQDHSLRNLQSY
jgi:hypothetical protein